MSTSGWMRQDSRGAARVHRRQRVRDCGQAVPEAIRRDDFDIGAQPEELGLGLLQRFDRHHRGDPAVLVGLGGCRVRGVDDGLAQQLAQALAAVSGQPDRGLAVLQPGPEVRDARPPVGRPGARRTAARVANSLGTHAAGRPGGVRLLPRTARDALRQPGKAAVAGITQVPCPARSRSATRRQFRLPRPGRPGSGSGR